jgi:hypothetical protein
MPFPTEGHFLCPLLIVGATASALQKPQALVEQAIESVLFSSRQGLALCAGFFQSTSTENQDEEISSTVLKQ